MKIKINIVMLILGVGIFFLSCSDHSISEGMDEKHDALLLTRAAFDNYFAWDSVNYIQATISNQQHNLNLPWQTGSGNNGGIPAEWLDPNATANDISSRYYARGSGWELVYSNMKEYSQFKYFALYHKYTGVLRFFFYEIASSSGPGSSQAFFGMKMDRSSSLFNFTTDLANAQTYKPSSPGFVTSSQGETFGGVFVSEGYKANNWYGVEVECAYDPNIKNNSGHNFTVKGWSVNNISITGNASTQGSIQGIIKMSSQSPSFNVNLSNMFSSNEKNIVADQGGVIMGLGNKIQQEKDRDPFFSNLWKNISRGAGIAESTLVQSGLRTIFDKGASVTTKALGKAVGSILGRGGNKPSVGKVDLVLQSNTSIDFAGSTVLSGWGTIQSLPVPGSTTNPNNLPLYNKPLGVWNLKKNPVLVMDIYMEENYVYDEVSAQFQFSLSDIEIVLNPEVEQLFYIANVSRSILSQKLDYYWFGETYPELACGFINSEKYYDLRLKESSYGRDNRIDFSSVESIISGNKPRILVSFDLVSKSDPQVVYSFSKHFPATYEEGDFDLITVWE